MALTPQAPPNSYFGCSSTFGFETTFFGRPRPRLAEPLGVPLDVPFAMLSERPLAWPLDGESDLSSCLMLAFDCWGGGDTDSESFETFVDGREVDS